MESLEGLVVHASYLHRGPYSILNEMTMPKAVPLSAKLLGDEEGDSGSLRPHNEHIKVCVDGSYSGGYF